MFLKRFLSSRHFFSLYATTLSVSKHHHSIPTRRVHLSWIFYATIVFLLPALACAAVPSGFKATVIAQNMVNPTAMAVSPDGRIFIGEQAGRIRIVDNNHLLSTALLNIKSKVDSNGERGLLGIALDPNFLVNQWIYVYYTSKTPAIHNRVSRFKVQGNSIVPGSEAVILDIQPLNNHNNHNGGALHFGTDGKLYIAVGDNAVGSNAQSLGNLKGKILRINKDGSIPTDNPFFKTAQGVNRAIWALGLRNPFTFAIQRGSGRMFINDVGQDVAEEINRGMKGANYGWPAVEGWGKNPKYRNPIAAYNHGNAPCAAIVGSAFYNPISEQFPAHFVGDYFFGDYCGGWIRRFDTTTREITSFASDYKTLVDLQVDPDGTLYILQKQGGKLTAVRWNG